MPQRYDPDAIYVGTGLIVAGALAAAMASVVLGACAIRLIRRAIRARRPQRAACRRRDTFSRQASEQIWAQFDAEERARDRGGSGEPS